MDAVRSERLGGAIALEDPLAGAVERVEAASLPAELACLERGFSRARAELPLTAPGVLGGLARDLRDPVFLAELEGLITRENLSATSALRKQVHEVVGMFGPERADRAAQLAAWICRAMEPPAELPWELDGQVVACPRAFVVDLARGPRALLTSEPSPSPLALRAAMELSVDVSCGA